MYQRFLAKKRAAQLWLDHDIVRESKPFTPKDEGTLESSADRASKFGSGLLIWATPYARRLYYGFGFKFDTTTNKKAGPGWVRRAKYVNLRRWVEGVAKILGGRVVR